MKIAFVTPGYDPRDIRRGSGTFFYLGSELERQGCELHYLGPLNIADPFPTRILRATSRYIFHGRYLTYLDPWVARARGRMLAQLTANLDYDLLFTNDHGVAAESTTDKPVIIYTDVMLPPIYEKHNVKPFTPLFLVSPMVVPLYQSVIRKSLKRASLSVFPAEWLRIEASQYREPNAKVAVFPFGANISDPGSGAAKNRDLHVGQLKLLFVGKDWFRKGGPMAVKITAALRERGIDATLHVVGPQLTNLPSFVKVHGLIDKNSISGWKQLDELYRTCHILLFPSLSEGSAISPREASAYGLPTLAYCIDGLQGSVNNGVNGVLIDIGADERGFLGVIDHWINNPMDYKRLAISARQFYEKNANWPSIVAKLLDEMEELLEHA